MGFYVLDDLDVVGPRALLILYTILVNNLMLSKWKRWTFVLINSMRQIIKEWKSNLIMLEISWRCYQSFIIENKNNKKIVISYPFNVNIYNLLTYNTHTNILVGDDRQLLSSKLSECWALPARNTFGLASEDVLEELAGSKSSNDTIFGTFFFFFLSLLLSVTVLTVIHNSWFWDFKIIWINSNMDWTSYTFLSTYVVISGCPWPHYIKNRPFWHHLKFQCGLFHK